MSLWASFRSRSVLRGREEGVTDSEERRVGAIVLAGLVGEVEGYDDDGEEESIREELR